MALTTPERASQSGGLSHATPRILFGVSGGIAAYKAVTAVRRLRQWGAEVSVVPTHSALTMVGRTTWEAISGHKVRVDVWEDADQVVHVNAGAQADLFVVAPATANTIAKLAHGLADNLLTNAGLVATCPRLIAPAMHTQMWDNPATVANVKTLQDRGWELIGPQTGQLTGSDIGAGRMSEPEAIAERAIAILEERGFSGKTFAPSTGQTWVISAGGTREAIDPVRYIANHSTGIMGVELANRAVRNGHRAILVAANISSDIRSRCLPNVEIIDVVSARDVHDAMDKLAVNADVVIMAAAISDFHVAAAETKIKRGESLTLHLQANPDILADLGLHRRRENQCVVGFAAETGDETHSYLQYGQLKAQRKGADLMVINKVGNGSGFGDVDTVVSIVNNRGEIRAEYEGNKADIAAHIVLSIEQWTSQHFS
ncbi:bifunctional phosphopantothenoylcysteine decarboxylase/phosphopantothenate--cysteine ligase CoaBC [Arcanobacterium pinnipediorum]|uniref:Coenzyme A biosynthesis bifunctional protein CoaBC n=1 Tax=Arcanobacterium pinnipediorum TaxID=1503041 RepID=A0ABY5AJ17_9ACTO|nr:bifunctional phosphopantothenoylcysteine decarboxylase/phosphopantothenate--cysteine ligase CoaBC [Arcanobacterium pinnipediorum]USR80194.1 bifunctional phosphopantothenoylcysteine decarboxylase/phosphopantothenate--cysteine ligase CoaBC [Arcanobacterium pinnipediorum]